MLLTAEGLNVYVDRAIGYSGNSVRFKDRPDVGERALLINIQVRTKILCFFCALTRDDVRF